MKIQQAYVFVDDGDPEASDYDNNYLSYFPAVPGSYERAVSRAGFGPWKATAPAAQRNAPHANSRQCSRRRARSARIRRTARPTYWGQVMDVLASLRNTRLPGT